MTPLEQKLYDALKRISSYDSAQKLHKCAEKSFGLSPEEVIEFAYENVRNEAAEAIKGIRRK